MSAAPRAALLGVALLCAAAVGAALYSQHRFDMQPCPWCVLQRLVFVLIGLAALLGAALPRPALRRGPLALIAVLALCGLAAALWQHFVAASSTSCNLTFADRLMSATGLDMRWPEVFAAYASCADAKGKLLGLPYETYSGALFIALFAAAWLLWPRARH